MTKRLLLLAGTLALSLSACTPNNKPKGEQKLVGAVELYNQANYRSTHRGMRLLGQGNTNEAYSQVQSESGSYFAVTNVRALVVPVDFTDYPASATLKGEAGLKKDLQDAIFGSSDDVEWESLKSYYEKASFGTCHISGEVTPVYHTGVSAQAQGAKDTSKTRNWAMDIQNWVNTTLTDVDLSSYDANHDGFVDSLIMIYTAPMHLHGSDDDLFWAFQWSVGASAGTAAKPNVDHFFWASYKFFYENGYYDGSGKYHDWTDAQIASGQAKVDAHTLIH